MRILTVYYSTYGQIHKIAEAIAEGVRRVDGAETVLRRVPETLPQDVLEKMGAVDALKTLAHIPICIVDELADADAVIFGTPTRFSNMCGQMRQFLNTTGQLWAQGRPVGQGQQRVRKQRNPVWETGIHYKEAQAIMFSNP